MSCDGNISKLEFGGTGKIQRLECCPPPKQEKQELVKNWKRTRRDLFSTVPTGYGFMSFSNMSGMLGLNGPPDPGQNAKTVPVIGIPPNSSGGETINQSPNQAPVPGDSASD